MYSGRLNVFAFHETTPFVYRLTITAFGEVVNRTVIGEIFAYKPVVARASFTLMQEKASLVAGDTFVP